MQKPMNTDYSNVILMRILFFCLGLASLFSISFAEDKLTPPAPAKVMRFVSVIVQRYDKDNDGILQQAEWQQMPGSPQKIDVDGNQQVTKDELVWYFVQYGSTRTIHRSVTVDLREPYKFDPANLQRFRPVLPRPVASAPKTEVKEQTQDITAEQITADEQPIDDDAYQKMLEERQIPAERPYHVLPEHLRGVPAWFVRFDKDGDGQMSLTEFAPTLAPTAVNLFKQLDKNSNGLIEPEEVRK